MDLADINVKVLYDFNYITRDRKEVSIKEGEKLFLIKKTNDDWWQVIRSSGRPFYVPASYVEEVSKHNNANNDNNDKAEIISNTASGTFQKVNNNTLDKIVKVKNNGFQRENNYRNRSCSFEGQKIHSIRTNYNSDMVKPVVVPRKRSDYEKVCSIPGGGASLKKGSNTKFINVKNHPDYYQQLDDDNYQEEEDEEADYVNLPKLDDQRVVNLKVQAENRRYSDKNNSMSASLSSTDSDGRVSSESGSIVSSSTRIASNGYSQVNIKNIAANNCNTNSKTLPLKNSKNASSADKVTVHLNLSNSLEELTKEINKKSSLIAAGVAAASSSDFNSSNAPGYRRVSDIVKDISKDTSIHSKNINNASSTNLKQVNHLSSVHGNSNVSPECERTKLQYVGSFKTKHEREKWAKNYVLLTAMKEEEMQEGSNNKGINKSKSNNNKIVNEIETDDNVKHDASGEENKILNYINDKNQKTLSAVNTTDDANVTIRNSVRICDRINSYEEKLIENEARISSSKQRPFLVSGVEKFVMDSSAPSNNVIDNVLNSISLEELNRNSPVYSTRNAPDNMTMKSSASDDKGSTDSLLGDDNPFDTQNGSLCTTASDSLLHTSDSSDEEFKHLVPESGGSGNQTSPIADDDRKKKKSALTRNGRIESCRLRFPVRGVSPPVPELNQHPTRELFSGWCEYTFSDGRTFFFNRKTGEKSWKPPRRRSSTESRKHEGSIGNLYSGSSSPLAGIEEVRASPTDNKNLNTITSGSGRSYSNESCSSGTASGSYPNTVGIENLKEYDKRVKVSPASPSDTLSSLPIGWRSYVDLESGFHCYVNLLTGAKWFSSNDEDGRVYYFEENSSESSWTLPSVTTFSSSEKLDDYREESETTSLHTYSNIPKGISRSPTAPITTTSSDVATVTTDVSNSTKNRSDKTKSLIVSAESSKNNDVHSTFVSKNWPQLWDGHMCVLKEGTLNRTKITENGKRVRKNWASSHVVLTELFLLFFKDAKTFTALKTGGGRPEMCVDLNGALIDRGDKVSSRKNVYIISTVLGLQVLIQSDCTQQADLWLLAIQGAIKNLPSGFDSCPRLTRGTIDIDNPSPENESSKKFYKVTRSKSVKTKNKDGSIEDLTVSPAERQTKIKARLKKFFHRRPTMEALVKKGIWKDEPAFGSYLEKVCPAESPRVPLFVQQCIACIEKSEDNMKTDGLYRASGNLSQVQKIRLQVDQNNLSVMDEEEDVHVLTGALKLFFRELKEPLIPFHVFHKAIKASNNHNKKEKVATFREITRSLPIPNYDTLKFLLQHLLRVTKYKEFNRMHIPNLAIVFGPTLMWPEQESMNMALDLMQQNLVIECFLLEFENIFK